MSIKWFKRSLVAFGLIAIFLVPALPVSAQTDPFNQACSNPTGGGSLEKGEGAPSGNGNSLEKGEGAPGATDSGSEPTGQSTSPAACDNPSRGGANPLLGPNGTLTKVTKLVSYIAGICAVIIIIVGGFMYVTSGGDPGKISSAKDAVLYALIGIVIAIIAQAIIAFVLNKIG